MYTVQYTGLRGEGRGAPPGGAEARDHEEPYNILLYSI